MLIFCLQSESSHIHIAPFLAFIMEKKHDAKTRVPTHSSHQPLTTSFARELLALLQVNLCFQMKSLSVTHPVGIVLHGCDKTIALGTVRDCGSPI